MNFLKPIRDNCSDSLLNSQKANAAKLNNVSDDERNVANNESKVIEDKEVESSNRINTVNAMYIKDSGDYEDIDLYRGGHSYLMNESTANNTWR